MILLVDIGNTSIKLALYNPRNNKITKPISLLTYSKKTLSFIKSYLKKNNINVIFSTSVVPKIFNIIKSFTSKQNIKLYEFNDKKINKSIKINVKKKSQVGSDRIVNSVGALSCYNKNCIIIDFGTTTTFDIVQKNNIYQGGVIAPGIELALKALNRFTAKLPLVKITKQKNVIGKDTIAAIKSGVFIGYTCLIDGIIDKIQKQSKKKYLIILTGGYSKLFKKSLKYKTIVNQDITLYGLVKTIKQNREIFDEF